MSEEGRRISALRMQLLEQHPFWGYLLMQVELIVDPTLDALAATDGHRRVWFNPDRTQALTQEQLGFVLVHEVGHHVQASFERERGRNRTLWNCATDYAINRVVAGIWNAGRRAPMYTPPAGVLLDKKYDGLIAEAIYERLLSDAPSVAVRVVQVAGAPVNDHGGGVDVHLPVNLTPEEREDLEERIRAAVAHWEASDQRGDAPADAVRKFGANATKVPWQRVLRRYVDAALSYDDLDPRRPSRRWLSEGAWVPGLTGERVGLVVVALDSSGSVGGPQLTQACAEIRSIAKEVQELKVIVADAEVQEVVDLDGLEGWLNRGKAKGGGGTDHRPVFQWVVRHGLRPDVFIGLTDLYSKFPERSPPYPVLWVVPPVHGAAPFGRVIEVDVE